MKTKYEYLIVSKDTNGIISHASSRSEARSEKGYYQDYMQEKLKIIQRKYVLAEEKVVR